MNYKNLTPEELQDNFFSKIGKEWMLIAAEKNGKCNCMTASWGGVGVLWNKNVFFCFIRPQRYTKEFCDASDTITLSFFSEEYRDALKLCGRVSGRDTDKISEAGLSVNIGERGEIIFPQSDMTIVGKKLYVQDMAPDAFVDKNILSTCYPGKDYHTVYVCEIIEIIKRID